MIRSLILKSGAFITLLFCMVFKCFGAVVPQQDLVEYVKIRSMVPDQRGALLRAFSPEKRRRWIGFIRNYDPTKSIYDQKPESPLMFEELLALGDSETGRWLIQQFRTNPDRENLKTLSFWHSAESIEFMAELCMSDAPYKVHRGAQHDICFDAPRILCDRQLSEMEILPAPVRRWAREMEDARGRSVSLLVDAQRATGRDEDPESHGYIQLRGREIIQKWWRANRQAVKEGRWNDVTPGENFHGPKLEAHLARLSGLARTKPRAEIFQGSVTPAPPSSSQTAPTSTVPEIAAATTAKSSESPSLPYIAAGLAAVLAAAALMVRAMRKTNSVR